MKVKIIILIIFNLFLNTSLSYSQSVNSKKLNLTQEELRCWQHKDIYKDSIFGISMDKVYAELIKSKKGEKVIVAVLDTEVDINHEDLKENIWVNKKETPNNGIDDDKNGYIDDINGWNFLGNSKGESVLYQNYEATRILRKFQKKFDENGKVSFMGNLKDSLLYHKVLMKKEEFPETIKANRKIVDFYTAGYPKALNTVKQYFPKGNYSIAQLDSLHKIVKLQSKETGRDIYFLRDVLKYGYSQKWFDDFKHKIEDEVATSYSDTYYDRALTGDDEEDINDKFYGNNNVSKNADWVYHSTQVTGLIAAKRKNDIGIKGISDNLKIMPINIVAVAGSENDKDVALGIKYAVDNGAKVINMSFKKTMSIHPEWVEEAILYAEKKDVLIIAGAGNEAENSDEIVNYPLDYNTDTGIEFCENFMYIGASTFNANENLVAGFSNYGQKNVDIFAPGFYLFTTSASPLKYVYNDGTSLATSVVSGIAGLIRSYYPKLTAKQVKQIIINSGIPYNHDVILPGTKDKKVPFSQLSRSGKVVNAYNAMLMAEEVSKNNRLKKQ